VDGEEGFPWGRLRLVPEHLEYIGLIWWKAERVRGRLGTRHLNLIMLVDNRRQIQPTYSWQLSAGG